MTERVIVKNSFAIGLVTMLQSLLPAVIAVGTLYALTYIYHLPPVDRDEYHVLAVLTAVLCLALPQPARAEQGEIMAIGFPLAISVIMRWLLLLGVLLAIGYMTKFSAEYSRRVVLTWAMVTPALLIVTALILHEVMRRLLFDPLNARKVVFAGCNESSQALANQLTRKTSDFSMSVLGFFDDRGPERLQMAGETKLLGKLPDLASYVKQNNVHVIFISLPIRHVQRVMTLLDDLRDTTASIYYLPDIFMFDLIQARTGAIHGMPVIAMCETPFYGLRGVTKRLTDVLISSLVLLMLAPVMIACALAVKLSSPGPIIFKQRRYGLNGEEILVYKFRSMTVLEDGSKVSQATREDPRITSIGRFLRRSSLDELPQLVNVLQGRMSLVGPRPHAVAHNEMYRRLIKGYMIRHKVLPGITGLAQVNGLRGETRTIDEMEARVKYDLEYLRNWSILLDFKILVKTFFRVLNDNKAF